MGLEEGKNHKDSTFLMREAIWRGDDGTVLVQTRLEVGGCSLNAWRKGSGGFFISLATVTRWSTLSLKFSSSLSKVFSNFFFLAH